MRPLVGILVGGAGRRMGHVAKGLLAVPGDGRPIVVRLSGLASQLCCDAVLVGEHLAYRGLGLVQIPDDPPGVGPIGGVRALLKHADSLGLPAAIVLACDMPFITVELLGRLLAEAPQAQLLAPRRSHWELLCARWSTRCLPALDAAIAAESHALQAIADAIDATELPMILSDGAQSLIDWDLPTDPHS